MRRRWRSSAGLLVAFAAISSLAACGGTSKASTQPFTLEPGTGAGQLRDAGTGHAYYPLTSAAATFVLTNRQSQDQTFAVSGSLAAASCSKGGAQTNVVANGAKVASLTAAATPQPFATEVLVPAGKSVDLDFDTTTGSCTSSREPNAVYASVRGLVAAYASQVVVTLGAGTGPNETVNGASINWVLAKTSTLTIDHRGGAGSKVAITGKLLPPPCDGAAMSMAFSMPGQPQQTVVAAAGSDGQTFTVSFSVPLGATGQVTMTTSTNGCHQPPDNRTFFAGFLNGLGGAPIS